MADARSELRTAALIARRYLLTRSHGYATLINWVSFIGLALGVMILTAVVSVMNGFDREIAVRLLSAMPHAVVTGTGDGLATELPGTVHVGRYFEGEAMLVEGGSVHFVALAGLEQGGLAELAETLGDGVLSLAAKRDGIVLGARLAVAKRLAIGDPVTLALATPGGRGVRSRFERFELVGTFEVGATADSALAIASREEIVRRGLLGAGSDGWRLHFADPFNAGANADAIREALPSAASVRFWMADYGELFRAVRIEKAIMFALLALVVAIAAFNIVSGQAMLVNDKRSDIAMLATMGASKRLLVATFFLQGFAVASIGIAGGLAAGVLVALNADALVGIAASLVGTSFIDGTWFDHVPSLILPADLLLIAAMSLGVALLAALLPALKAIGEHPAAALHAA